LRDSKKGWLKERDSWDAMLGKTKGLLSMETTKGWT